MQTGGRRRNVRHISSGEFGDCGAFDFDDADIVALNSQCGTVQVDVLTLVQRVGLDGEEIALVELLDSHIDGEGAVVVRKDCFLHIVAIGGDDLHACKGLEGVHVLYDTIVACGNVDALLYQVFDT